MASEDRKKIAAVIKAGIAAAVILALWWATANSSSSQPNIEALAKCLTETESFMYGTPECSHCVSQKALFGGAFKHVTFIDCSQEPDGLERCKAVGVRAYPTWIMGDGTYLAGEQALQVLAEASGCSLTE